MTGGDEAAAAPGGGAAPARTGAPPPATRRAWPLRLWLGLGLLGLLTLAAVLGPALATAHGLEAEMPDLLERFAPASAAHPLGRDELGRDVLARLLAGARVSLAVGLATALVATALGTAVGVLAAWKGGWVEALLMRLADGLLALPALPLLVLLAAADTSVIGLPRGEATSDVIRIVAILAAFGWVGVARLARAAALSVLARDWVRAARALGASEARVLARHVLPSLAAPVSVAAALSAAGAILAESTLSFLGLGIQPPVPSWGNMLANAQDLVLSAPWVALWPGLAIVAAVAGFTLLADGVRRAGAGG
ncbi:ABC transporter permease [Roseomonas sp. OT10]|uniref:ABC transporter permease n=1 Tax=Roseomonas cutis TaxID=2897332 RepID=UPI001E390738|nr:ABC transporter permease [Roseomonas sp. OT10]UFN48771.1 ABC transporter permease [Roseomonas sp. OT10]